MHRKTASRIPTVQVECLRFLAQTAKDLNMDQEFKEYSDKLARADRASRTLASVGATTGAAPAPAGGYYGGPPPGSAGLGGGSLLPDNGFGPRGSPRGLGGGAGAQQGSGFGGGGGGKKGGDDWGDIDLGADLLPDL